MKKLLYTIAFLSLFVKLYSQDLPKDFEDTVSKEYYSIPEEARQNELSLSFEEYLKSRIQTYKSRQQFYASLNAKSVTNLCDNGTFESGNININDWNFYWEGNQGSVSGTNRLNTGTFTGPPNNQHANQVHHQVVSNGQDPNFPALDRVWNFPTGNSKSLRLGNAHENRGLETVAKQITITPSNALLTFSYALVMEDPTTPPHGNNLPFFEVNIIEAGNFSNNYNHLINLGNNSNRISSNNPLLIPNNTTAVQRWKDWTCVTADLSSLIGKTVIIEFVNRDCWLGAHWGYTYLDNLCVSCEGADGNEGSIQINQGESDDCGFPGQICIDYTLPDGDNPSLDLELEIIQNGTTVNTLTSPTLTSGNSYCFNLTTTNTSGLDNTLQGFDFKVTGHPSLDTFNLTPQTIGSSSSGVESGNNNDYDILCPSNFDCCQTDLSIWTNSPDVLPVSEHTSNGTNLSVASETYIIHADANIPITELRVNVTDIDFEYNYDQCAECINNPALWGSIYSPNNTIGSAPDNLTQTSIYPTNLINSIDNGKNMREVKWDNPNGAMLQNGDTFEIHYLLPPISKIPCCVTSIEVCIKISWKDANCNVCEINTCTPLELSKK